MSALGASAVTTTAVTLCCVHGGASSSNEISLEILSLLHAQLSYHTTSGTVADAPIATSRRMQESKRGAASGAYDLLDRKIQLDNSDR